MKKLFALVLALCMILGMVACGDTTTTSSTGDVSADAKTPVKVGFICLHDETSTYDLNFLKGVDEVKAALNLTDDQVIVKTNIAESQACYDAAADLVDQGCNIIFANSFGHETFIIEAAKEFPNVQFCHATGVKAHTENLPNFHNAFASIYEGRYLAGVAAGLKLNEMIAAGTITADKAVVGYVGAFPYAEVISGYTSFFLGVRSICETATMKVDFTGSWYDPDAEKNTANALMDLGCVLISQHADSMGAPSACEARNVPNVSYNGSTEETCPNTFIVSSRINWAPYYEYMINCVANGEAIAADWTGTIATGSVVLTDLGAKCPAEGTAAKIEEIKTKLQNGELKVFDTSKFTVAGAALTEEHLADVDDDGTFVPETKVVADGYFHESEYRSAPYFDVNIDGIERLDNK